MASSSGATFTEARDEWMKEMHEKPKLSMLKLIAECEIKSVNVVSDPDLDWPTAVPEVRKHENSLASVGTKIFRKIKRGDRHALSSHGRFTDVQCSHLIAHSPCDFCPKRPSIRKRLPHLQGYLGCYNWRRAAVRTGERQFQ